VKKKVRGEHLHIWVGGKMITVHRVGTKSLDALFDGDAFEVRTRNCPPGGKTLDLFFLTRGRRAK
jgi:hypothetical protein